jgi:Zn-dependent protease
MSSIVWTIVSFLCFIPAMVFHEVSHGLMAYKLGDPTAKSMGRLSLNPIKHIDPFGTVLLPLMMLAAGIVSGAAVPIFGYAKPVPYNPRYFKNIRKGEVLTGLAGPAANLIMGLIGALAGVAFFEVYKMGVAPGVLANVVLVCYMFTLTNFYLMFFNLIPIPPLDGSSIIAPFLSDRALQKYYSIQQYALPVLIIVLFVVPMIVPNFNPIGIFLNGTAGNLANLLFPYIG